MPVTVQWGNEQQTIIVMTAVGEYTVEELFDVLGGIRALLDSVDHKVSIIADYSQCPRLPRQTVTTFPRIAAEIRHPNTSGTFVVVGAQHSLRTMIEIFSKVFGQIRYADTLDEAYAIIAGMSPQD